MKEDGTNIVACLYIYESKMKMIGKIERRGRYVEQKHVQYSYLNM